jgi:flagellar P-ring protein precursor FlgI
MKKHLLLFGLVCVQITFFQSVIFAEAQSVRIKDIGKIVEARDNQLLGFGLVIGLRNTGDSKNTGFTDTALTNLLKKMGISGTREFNSKNVASVMVTASLPPYAKKGQKISVTVSSLGDSSSLVGGTLLVTPLQGVDLKTYAVAQGPVIVNGISEQSPQTQVYKNQPTVGTIPQGAIVEEEVPITNADQLNITIVLKDPNFITVTKATRAIQSRGFPNAKATDANTIKIPLSDLDSADIINTIAKLENISFIPDSSSKIIINSRTGTVVIGEMVKLSPVALTHGNISIRINNQQQAGGGAAAIFGAAGNETQDSLRIEESDNKVLYLNPSSTLSSLVNALNEIGATPKDLIAIIQALQESGALVGNIEIL